MRTNNKAVTPTIVELIKTIMASEMIDMNVCLPGKIVKYDSSTQFADVQPQLLSKYEDGSLVALPVIPNVPVKHPRAAGGQAFVHMPLAPGDDVTLIFSHRSLDNWKTQGGMSDPADRRKFHMSDAIALVGGSALPDAFTPETDDSIEIVNQNSKVLLHPDGQCEIRASDEVKTIIYPDGKYEIKGGLNKLDDLVKLFSTLVQAIQRSYTLTLIGPQPLVDPRDPDWSLLITRANAFANGIDPLPPGGP